MKNRSIELQLIKPVSGRSNMKGRITLKDLQKELLTDLNVPFADFCCQVGSQFPLGAPVRYFNDELQYLGDDEVWTAAGSGGGGARFGYTGEDVVADANRSFDFDGFTWSVGNGLSALFQFDSINISSQTEGSMILAQWNSQVPVIQLGDLGNWGNGTIFKVDDADSSILLNNIGDGTLFNVFGGGTFYAQLGNNGIGSGTNMYIDDSTRIFEVASTESMLRLNKTAEQYMFGHYDQRSGIFIDDSLGTHFIDIYATDAANTNYNDIYMDAVDGVLTFDTNSPGNGASIYMNLTGDRSAIQLNALNGIRTTGTGGSPATSALWLLGQQIAGAVTPDTTRYIDVKVAGVSYKLIIAV